MNMAAGGSRRREGNVPLEDDVLGGEVRDNGVAVGVGELR
jgi:hypothetical protein